MSNKTSSATPTKLDGLKWAVVFALILVGVAGNYYYGAESFLYRVLALLVLAAVAGYIGLQTAKGVAFWSLLKEARIELRKVVWPTKTETRQTTLIVLAVVAVVAVMLWGLDSLLSWIVSGIIG